MLYVSVRPFVWWAFCFFFVVFVNATMMFTHPKRVFFSHFSRMEFADRFERVKRNPKRIVSCDCRTRWPGIWKLRPDFARVSLFVVPCLYIYISLVSTLHSLLFIHFIYLFTLSSILFVLVTFRVYRWPSGAYFSILQAICVMSTVYFARMSKRFKRLSTMHRSPCVLHHSIERGEKNAHNDHVWCHRWNRTGCYFFIYLLFMFLFSL